MTNIADETEAAQDDNRFCAGSVRRSFGRYWRLGREKHFAPAAAIGALMAISAMAAVHLIGHRFGVIVNLFSALDAIPAGVPLFYLLLGASVLLSVGACLVVVYGAYDAALERSAPPSIVPFGISLKNRFAKYMGLIVLCWLPWVIGHFPGAFDDDTAWQLLIWHNPSAWTDHHPWFTTALYGMFVDAGLALGSSSIGLIAHSVLVMLLCAASMSFMLCYLRRFSVPKPLLYGSIACICAVPLFASYASETVKDTSFTWAWVVFCVLFAESVRTRGACFAHARYPIAMALLGLWMCLTRKTGLYIMLIILVVLLIAVAPRRRLVVAGTMAGLVACMAIYSSALLPAWGVNSGLAKEAYSIVLQQTARTVSLYPEDVSEEERAAIDEVVLVSDMQEHYEPFLADPVKDRWRSPTAGEIGSYLVVWAKMGLRHPLTYASASFLTSKDLFVPFMYFETKNDMNSEWVDGLGVFFYNGGDAEADAIMLDGLKQFEAFDALREFENGCEFVLFYRTPLRFLFSMSFLAFWLPLAVMLFTGSARGLIARRRCLMAFVPFIVLMLTLIAGPVVIPRYCLPAAFAFPLILMMPFVFAIRPHEE